MISRRMACDKRIKLVTLLLRWFVKAHRRSRGNTVVVREDLESNRQLIPSALEYHSTDQYIE